MTGVYDDTATYQPPLTRLCLISCGVKDRSGADWAAWTAPLPELLRDVFLSLDSGGDGSFPSFAGRFDANHTEGFGFVELRRRRLQLPAGLALNLLLESRVVGSDHSGIVQGVD